MTPVARPAVFRIGYVEVGTAQPTEAEAYYTDIIGANVIERGDAGAVYLSLGLYHHDITLRPTMDVGTSVIGYQVRPDLPLDDLARQLASIGLRADRRGCSRPGVADLLQISLAGHTFQFFHDISMPAPGFVPAAIAPNRIGHVALLSPEAGKLVTFFTEGLGFAQTDWFEHLVTFLTCNHDHHVMNVIEAPIAKIHHIAFELRGQPQQFLAADLLARSNRPIVWGPSRHTAGHNLATYHYGPDRQLIELYTDMDVYVPELGYFQPRPWHDTLPQRPKRWPLSDLTTWQTAYEFDFSRA